MLSPAQMLTLTQWLSPAFPVGAFAYSHGLEVAVQSGEVSNASEFAAWLDVVLRHGAGRNDAIFMRLSSQTRDPAHLDALNRAMQPSDTRLLETDRMGAALCETIAAIWSDMPQGLSYPIALGQAARAEAMPITPVVQMALHAFAANLTSAATRLVPLGQTQAQKILGAANATCLAIAEDTEDATRHDIGAGALLTDIHAMSHDTLYSRMFRS